MDQVKVQLDISKPYTQTLDVTITWKPSVRKQRITMPIWTPGSYKVRDHAQNIYEMYLYQGNNNLALDREDTNLWTVNLDITEELKLVYKLRAVDFTVRTCYIDDEICSLALSAAICLIEEKRNVRHCLEVLSPKNWKVYVPLVKESSFLANNYDHLVDSPVHSGILNRFDLTVRTFRHQMIVSGSDSYSITDKFLSDVSSICETTCSLVDQDPPSKDLYQIILHLVDKGYGGLEHDDSSVLIYSWKDLHSEDNYRKLLQLIGHEYLHQWNVRRLRPIEYKNYNYSKAIISDSLWFAEGITSYFDLSIPFLAGLTTLDKYLEDLSDEITYFMNCPANALHNLADCSREAWIKLYNRKPSTRDYQINYYRHGVILSFCLDVYLRRKGYSLSYLLREVWKLYGKNGKGYCRSDIITILNLIDIELGHQLSKWLDNNLQIPLEQVIGILGLELSCKEIDNQLKDITFEIRSELIYITWLNPNGIYSQSGLSIGDEIISVNGIRINHIEVLTNILLNNQSVEILYSRRGKTGSRIVKGFSKREKMYSLSVNTASDYECQKLRELWLEFK